MDSERAPSRLPLSVAVLAALVAATASTGPADPLSALIAQGSPGRARLAAVDEPAATRADDLTAKIRRRARRLRGQLVFRAPGRAGALSTLPLPGNQGEWQRLGRGAAQSKRKPLRYAVEVEGALHVDWLGFAAEVEQTLSDRRGWAAVRHRPLRRVDSGRVDFRVALAGRPLTDRLCLPLQTLGRYSCQMHGRAILNAWRWRHGAAAYRGDLASYRRYMINHEVGHALGYGHQGCPRAGARAPVMMQQTKGVGPCRPYPWPG